MEKHAKAVRCKFCDRRPRVGTERRRNEKAVVSIWCPNGNCVNHYTEEIRGTGLIRFRGSLIGAINIWNKRNERKVIKRAYQSKEA